MPRCSSPVSCQLAKRELCNCACGGANHGILRARMENPETREQAEQELAELRKQQVEEKKRKKVERRKVRSATRAQERKSGKE